MARPLRIDFGCAMTEITRRGEASLLLGRQDSQGIGEGKFTIQDLTPHLSSIAYCPPVFAVLNANSLDYCSALAR